MKHMILAKFKPEIADKAALMDRAEEIFSAADQVPGVHGAKTYRCCVDRSNRYDLMIVLDMDREALSVYDDCEMHHTWKREFGDLLEKKAIFDWEE